MFLQTAQRLPVVAPGWAQQAALRLRAAQQHPTPRRRCSPSRPPAPQELLLRNANALDLATLLPKRWQSFLRDAPSK